MNKKTFNSLKEGDEVLCMNGSKGVVVRNDIIDVHNSEPMVKLDCENPQYACPYYFRYELDKKL